MTRRFQSRLAVILSLLLPAVTLAQGGSIAGKVTESGKSQPLGGAQITVRDGSGNRAGSAVSGSTGSYRVENLAAGTYSVLVTLIPFGPKQVEGVQVQAGGTATVDVTMVGQAFQLSEIKVTSVSRVPEKLTEAPASITVIPAVRVQDIQGYAFGRFRQSRGCARIGARGNTYVTSGRRRRPGPHRHPRFRR